MNGDRVIVAEQAYHAVEEEAEPLWCYLVSLHDHLAALPDDDHVVLLPYIGEPPRATPLPLGVVPPYILGLINVAQRGELLVDLPLLLRLRDTPLAPGETEGRRIVVYGEALPPERDDYRLAFAVDRGYELLDVTISGTSRSYPFADYVRAMVETPRGEAALLDMEAVCNVVLRDMGADRLWNQPWAEDGAGQL